MQSITEQDVQEVYKKFVENESMNTESTYNEDVNIISYQEFCNKYSIYQRR